MARVESNRGEGAGAAATMPQECVEWSQRRGAVPAWSGLLYIMREFSLIMKDFLCGSNPNALLQTAVHGFLSPGGVGIKFAFV